MKGEKQPTVIKNKIISGYEDRHGWRGEAARHAHGRAAMGWKRTGGSAERKGTHMNDKRDIA